MKEQLEWLPHGTPFSAKVLREHGLEWLLYIEQATDHPSGNKRSGDDFISLFNGEDLSGWEGDDEFWSVEDGAITGESSGVNVPSYNRFLIWKGGELEDFELRLEYRIESGNSGIQYRSVRREDLDKDGRPKTFSLSGYQADIDPAGGWTGGNYGEGLRMTFANRGERSTFEDGQPKRVEIIGDADELWKKVRINDWNDYRIVAKGNSLQHYINGQFMSEVIDSRFSSRKSGLLGLQLHGRKPMKVQFRNIRLKRLAAE